MVFSLQEDALTEDIQDLTDDDGEREWNKAVEATECPLLRALCRLADIKRLAEKKRRRGDDETELSYDEKKVIENALKECQLVESE